MTVRAVLLLLATTLRSQDLHSFRLFSEFYPDHGADPPREILSPGVARNAFFTLQAEITADPKTMYFLAVQSNPEKAFRWIIYKVGPNGALEQRREPYFEVMPEKQTHNFT